MKQFWVGIIGAAVFGSLVLIGVREVRNRHLPAVPEKPTVRIGVLYPMSGDGAAYGNAAKTAVGVVKAEADGVINGQPVLKEIVNGKPTVVEE